MSSPSFNFTMRWPMSDTTSLQLSVATLMACGHGHWFLVQKDDNQLSFNTSGAGCLRDAGIPGLVDFAYE